MSGLKPGGGSDQVFYPSLVVNLRLLFDESLRIEEQASIPDALPSSGIVDAVTSSQPPTVRPLVTQRGNTNFSFVTDRVPRTASVELPSYRTAGKFTLEIDWRELPIDPTVVRAAAVEIYAGSVDPTDFSTGMVRQEANGTRRSILSVTRADGSPRDDLMLLTGLVDNWSIERSDTSSLKLEGRDLRGVLLDSPINPDIIAKIDLRRDVVSVIHDIMLKHPVSQFMYIVYNPNDWPNQVIPPVADPEGLTRVRRKAAGDDASGGAPTGDQTSFWDLITQYCYLVGAVPFFRGRFLVIRPARSIFDQSKPTGQDPAGVGAQAISVGAAKPGSTVIGQTWDPVFATGVRLDDQNKPFSIRKLIFGRNVKKLSFERKYTGVKVPVIQAVSYDTSSKNRGNSKLLTATWPDSVDLDKKGKVIGAKTADAVTGVAPSGDTSNIDVKRISVPGIRDQKKLLEIAKNLYEEIGRGEFGGSCETMFLSSFKGDNTDPDMLRLRPGHAVEFAMDARGLSSLAPAASSELQLERMSFDAAAREIQRVLRTTDENLPRALVASSRSSVIGQLRQFRTANVKFNWTTTSGIQISFDFQNYIVARYGVTEQLGANTQPATQKPITRSPTTQARGNIHAAQKKH